MSVTFDEYMMAHTWPTERFLLKVESQWRGSYILFKVLMIDHKLHSNISNLILSEILF